MAHSYISCHLHCVFSIKERQKTIAPEFRERLHQFIGGIAREHGLHAVIVGGTDDHGHVLLAIPQTITVAKAIQLIKGASS